MTTYVYGIAGADLPRLPEGLVGVGDPPRAVRVLRENDTAAVVSDCPEGLRPKRRDLFAHQRVLTAAAAAGAVLPLRFGSTAPDDDAVRGALARHADLYRGQLETVADRVEYNIKALHREDVLLRAILAENPEIRKLNEATRVEGGATYQDRLRLGQLVADAVRDRELQDARTVEYALATYAEHHRRGPDGAGRVVNLSFLVGRDEAVGFLAALEELRAGSPHLDIRISGPLPPYSFVRTDPVEAA
ncbi:GvpL/GvpF family gas vesicle protein [Streptomyces sp. NBC_01803]|uniref:GvpL/GvpF family gas vesicle protein n=1 Tax=Streptomyces sp. NBC_01803 TaxID=2975946 RepID=UPI002DDADC70|nr:GvpL/GvpF family gas vesicle protein [Streptomyces sp. NBC_01803]WSA46939.1 GvpL/GvpF family gas vesicle protein [Streptomyces sp. NBC_01803]